jgi:PadR family transcriptional regulator, regulatory protein PadR
MLAQDVNSETLPTLFRNPITGVVMAINRKLLNREILLGFWKVHILHHAAEGPLVGQWMLHELREHGYHVSPGTLYPLLRRMEKTGWLRCRVDKKAGPKARREYFLTLAGREALKEVLVYLQELRGEVVEARKKSP